MTFPLNVLNKKTGLWERAILEEDVIQEIVTRLGYCGIYLWRIRERIPGQTKRGNRTRMSTPGIPDLLGHVPKGFQNTMWGLKSSILAGSLPVPIYIEAKRPGFGIHRVAQTRFIQDAKEAGCIAFFAECWKDCVEEFKEYGIALPE